MTTAASTSARFGATVSSKDFHAAVRVVRATARASSMPMLSRIALRQRTARGGLSLESTDLVTTTRVVVSHETAFGVGETHVHAAGLLSIARLAATAGELRIACDRGKLNCAFGKRTVRCTAGNENEYMTLPPSPTSTHLVMERGELLRMLEDAARVASKDDTRPHLSGVFVQVYEQQFRCVATDGHRVVRLSLPVDKHAESFSALLPLSSIPAIVRALKTLRPESVSLASTGDHFAVIGPSFEVIVRKNLATFPPYEHVFPESFASAIEVPRAWLESALHLALDLTSGTKVNASARIESDGRRVRVESLIGDDRCDEEIEHETGVGRLAFRVSYMLDALRLISSETVRIELNGELDPFSIAGPRGQSLVMPQRF